MSLEHTAHDITYKPKDRIQIFGSLKLPEQCAVFGLLSPYIQQDILTRLSLTKVVDVLDHLDLVTAEKVVKQIKDTKRRYSISRRLRREIREKIDTFLQFHPKASETLVHLNYLFVSEDTTIGEVGNAIDEHHDETGRFPEILVHSNGELRGYIPMATLVKERNTARLARFVKPLPTIVYSTEPTEILEFVTSKSHKKVAVLDNDGSVLGILYADDVLALFGKLPAETLYNVAGLDQAELPHDTVIQKFRNRYKWLILNLVTCFGAASVIVLFEDTIDQLALMAVFIPIVAGMGSNVGSQAFAVMLRGLVMGTITWKNGLPAVRNEIITAAITGTMIGAIVTIVSFMVYGSLMLGLVVTVSMIGVHMIGGLFGAFIPLLLKRYGVDPAGVTTILLTTATDIFGLFFLLGLGTWLLL